MRKLKLPWNWRDRIEIVKDIEKNNITYYLNFKEDKVPRGFKEQIGSITVDKKGYHLVEHAALITFMHGRGLGRMMYEHALLDLGTISTTYHEASDQAQRVWDSLMRDYYYETDFWNQRLILTTE